MPIKGIAAARLDWCQQEFHNSDFEHTWVSVHTVIGEQLFFFVGGMSSIAHGHDGHMLNEGAKNEVEHASSDEIIILFYFGRARRESNVAHYTNKTICLQNDSSENRHRMFERPFATADTADIPSADRLPTKRKITVVYTGARVSYRGYYLFVTSNGFKEKHKI